MDEETLIKALRDHVTYLRKTERAFYQAQAAGNLTAQLAEQLNDARKSPGRFESRRDSIYRGFHR